MLPWRCWSRRVSLSGQALPTLRPCPGEMGTWSYLEGPLLEMPSWSRHIWRTKILVLNRVSSARAWNGFPWSPLPWKCLPFSTESWLPHNCGSGNLLSFLLFTIFWITVWLATSFFPSFPLLIRYLLASLLGAVSDMQNESVILSLFLFLPAKCEPACRHGGVCVRPNKCLCKKGYLGPQCEQVDRNIRRVTRAGILDQIIDMTSYLLDLTSYIV